MSALQPSTLRAQGSLGGRAGAGPGGLHARTASRDGTARPSPGPPPVAAGGGEGPHADGRASACGGNCASASCSPFGGAPPGAARGGGCASTLGTGDASVGEESVGPANTADLEMGDSGLDGGPSRGGGGAEAGADSGGPSHRGASISPEDLERAISDSVGGKAVSQLMGLVFEEVRFAPG
jgi:hypothetical protein